MVIGAQNLSLQVTAWHMWPSTCPQLYSVPPAAAVTGHIVIRFSHFGFHSLCRAKPDELFHLTCHSPLVHSATVATNAGNHTNLNELSSCCLTRYSPLNASGHSHHHVKDSKLCLQQEISSSLPSHPSL